VDNKDIAREWFELAKADLSSARFLKKMRPIRYPFHLDINETDMKLALKSAQKIKRFVLNKTKK
jgi:hypothetical protein